MAQIKQPNQTELVQTISFFPESIETTTRTPHITFTSDLTAMFIPKRRSLRFLVGFCFVLILLPFNPTTATDIEEHEQSRELTTKTTTPPWATGSYCTPDGPFYNPGAVDECRDCCKERKCRNRCLNQCKSDASSKAQSRKEYCRSYRGYEKDGPPDWTTCSNKLGEYKESHCSDYDRCVTKYEAWHTADDAWYYCDDLHVPALDCSAFGECVKKEKEEGCSGDCGTCGTNSTQSHCPCCNAAKDKGDEAADVCRPDKYVGGKCDGVFWDPDCDCNWRDDWCDACEANHCNDILKELQFAKDHSKSGSKSGSKGRRAICDDFWYCIEEYERDYDGSESREKGDDARRDCNRCENNGGACKDEVGDDHEKGKNNVCLSYLGGWDRSCNSYYDCWNDLWSSECDACANNVGGVGCDLKYDQCMDFCLESSIVSCDDECDVCFCESDPDLAIEECQAIGDDCCKDPYGWLNDPDMRSLEYIRECTSSNDCGTCRGNCETNADCHNVNLCSKDLRNPKGIYDIPGCKGDPAKVRVPGGRPLEVGYCYNPNKSYPDHTTVTNHCLAKITTNGYGKCCGLPTDASQCGQTFNNYCALKPDVPIIQPGEPGTGGDAGTPVIEPVQYTGSYCGTSLDDICSPCPSVDNDDGCSGGGDGCPDNNQGCFTDFTCPGCFVQTAVVERSGGG